MGSPPSAPPKHAVRRMEDQALRFQKKPIAQKKSVATIPSVPAAYKAKKAAESSAASGGTSPSPSAASSGEISASAQIPAPSPPKFTLPTSHSAESLDGETSLGSRSPETGSASLNRVSGEGSSLLEEATPSLSSSSTESAEGNDSNDQSPPQSAVYKNITRQKRSLSSPHPKKRLSMINLVTSKVEKTEEKKEKEISKEETLSQKAVKQALEGQEVKWGSSRTPSELLLVLQQEAAKLNALENRQFKEVEGSQSGEGGTPIVIPRGDDAEAHLRKVVAQKKAADREARKAKRRSNRATGSEISFVRSDVPEQSTSMLIQSPSLTSPITQSTSDEPELSPRSKVVQEVWETEKAYVNDLKIVIDVYLKPLKENQLLTPVELQTLFSNWETLLNVNKILLNALRESGVEYDEKDIGKINWHTMDVGKCFLEVAQMFKVYSTYCVNQTTATDFLQDKIQKNQQIAEFMDNAKNRVECRRLDLNSYLIKPLQRITKYPLLLRELIKNTTQDHPHSPSLNKAFEAIQDTVNKINESKRQLETQLQMMEIQKSIESKEDLELIQPGRAFINEGKILFVSRKFKTKDGYYFLFNDLMLLVKQNAMGSCKWKLKQKLLLRQILCVDVLIPDIPFAIELIVAGAKKLWVAVSTMDEKKSFMQTVQEKIESSRMGTKLVNKEGASVQQDSPQKTRPQSVIYQRSTSGSAPIPAAASTAKPAVDSDVLRKFSAKPIPRPPSTASQSPTPPLSPFGSSSSLPVANKTMRSPGGSYVGLSSSSSLQSSSSSTISNPSSLTSSLSNSGATYQPPVRAQTVVDLSRSHDNGNGGFIPPLKEQKSAETMTTLTSSGSSSNLLKNKLSSANSAPSVVPEKNEKPAIALARAKYKYAATNAQEISLVKGDLVEVLEKHVSGWWTVRCNGKEGFAPSNYLIEEKANVNNGEF